MSSHNRPDRVAQLLQERLGELFARGLKDPRVGLVTITGVKMTVDLREARVYWTVHGETSIRRKTERGIAAARGYLRHEVAQSLGLRVAPELRFTYDEAIDRGARIEELLREVRDENARRHEPGPRISEEE